MKSILLLLLLASCALGHGRFYPILSKVRSDSVVERKTGRFYCDLAGHSWAWGDTTRKYLVGVPCPENRPGCCVDHVGWVTEDELIVDWQKGCESRFECPAICRNCLTDTLAVWSYAEDQQRKQADKNPTEYEMLKARKK